MISNHFLCKMLNDWRSCCSPIIIIYAMNWYGGLYEPLYNIFFLVSLHEHALLTLNKAYLIPYINSSKHASQLKMKFKCYLMPVHSNFILTNVPSPSEFLVSCSMRHCEMVVCLFILSFFSCQWIQKSWGPPSWFQRIA